jgi:DTW domain-containing protein YfiP
LQTLFQPQFYEASKIKLQDLPEDQRYEAMCKLTIARADLRNHICNRCWLAKPQCMCNHWQTIDLSPVRFFIIMHSKEYKRTSNTGKILLCSAAPGQAELLLGGTEHCEEVLSRIVDQPNTFILFPGVGECLLRDI